MSYNIVLTGFMGTGKTTVGKLLSTKLGKTFIDIDEEIEREACITINEIFMKHGEKYFREIETEMIKKHSSKQNLILATGGGTVLKEENMQLLRNNGIIINLFATPQVIYERLKDKDDRPLLKVENPLIKIEELLEYRTPFYKNTDLFVNTHHKPLQEIIDDILDAINKHI
ncbi:Shikimate kinase [Candidatus Magnetoovum chiemensis]|nr:Shikimate kinase [Candidatus Magnetoovum chiemensis]